MDFTIIETNGKCKCRGSCGKIRIPKGTYQIYVELNTSNGWAGSYICINCFQKDIVGLIETTIKDIDILQNKDKNIALLNIKNNNKIIRDHCERILKDGY